MDAISVLVAIGALVAGVVLLRFVLPRFGIRVG
jgi:hypothetical protein